MTSLHPMHTMSTFFFTRLQVKSTDKFFAYDGPKDVDVHNGVPVGVILNV